MCVWNHLGIDEIIQKNRISENLQQIWRCLYRTFFAKAWPKKRFGALHEPYHFFLWSKKIILSKRWGKTIPGSLWYEGLCVLRGEREAWEWYQTELDSAIPARRRISIVRTMNLGFQKSLLSPSTTSRETDIYVPDSEPVTRQLWKNSSSEWREKLARGFICYCNISL